MMPNSTFTCNTCRVVSTPEERIMFATEDECWRCFAKRCDEKNNRIEELWRKACLENKCMPAYWYTNKEALLQFVADLKKE